MSEIKLKHSRTKSNIDPRSIKKNPPVNIMSKDSNNTLISQNNQIKSNNLKSKNPFIVKLRRYSNTYLFDDEKVLPKEIDSIIINKYENVSLIKTGLTPADEMKTIFNRHQILFKGEKVEFVSDPNNKSQTEIPTLNIKSITTNLISEVKEGQESDPNNKSQTEIPTVNIKSFTTNLISEVKEGQEELLEMSTQRDCSFINNISFNNSNYIVGNNLEKKENDVVLCISNLDLNPSLRDNKLSNIHPTILNSEEKFINKSEIEDISNCNSNNENTKLIGKVQRTKFNIKQIAAILIIILVLFILLTFIYIYVYVIFLHTSN